MASLHFCDEALGDIVHRERVSLFGQHRMEENLQKQISKFFAELGVVAAANRIIDFVGFFNQIWAQ